MLTAILFLVLAGLIASWFYRESRHGRVDSGHKDRLTDAEPPENEELG